MAVWLPILVFVPGCPTPPPPPSVIGCLVLLSCSGRLVSNTLAVQAVFFWRSCSDGPVRVVLFWLSCSVCPVLAVLFLLSCPGASVLAAHVSLSCYFSPILAFLVYGTEFRVESLPEFCGILHTKVVEFPGVKHQIRKNSAVRGRTKISTEDHHCWAPQHTGIYNKV